MHAGLQLTGPGHELLDAERLQGEGDVHHRRRVSLGGREVDDAAAREQVQAAAVAEVIALDERAHLLGVLLTFSPSVLYTFYEHRPHYWGLTPLEDQSIGGATMALEQAIVMGIAMVWLFVRALGESEREEERAERYGAA